MLNANFITRGLGPNSDIVHLLLGRLSVGEASVDFEDIDKNTIVLSSNTEVIRIE